MDFKFSVDELVVMISSFRDEYRYYCECANIARQKQLTASTDDSERVLSDIVKYYDKRCETYAGLYKKIIGRNIVEDL